ncbi:MAG: hypothetical protein U9P00_13035 [Pseudomonadota bacterium]|nr:hypothetical protein [Pseudomonadota bacterium]
MRNLPQLHKAAEMPIIWRRIKGDPVIRQALFYQQRISSVMDAYLNPDATLFRKMPGGAVIFQLVGH